MHFNASSAPYLQAINRTALYFQHAGGLTASAAQARALAEGSLYQQLIRQSTQLAYLDVIAVLAVGSACMIPLIFLMKKHKGPAAAH